MRNAHPRTGRPENGKEDEEVLFFAEAEVLAELRETTPRLASWDKRDHPSQVRLRRWLDEAHEAVGAALDHPGKLFLDLEVGLPDGVPLLRHHDLENYLTPLVAALGPDRFALVAAEKSEGGPSRLRVGVARPAEEPEGPWGRLRLSTSETPDSKAFKQEVREQVLQAAEVLGAGPVAMHMAIRYGSRRRWTNLWKCLGDGLGPLLGEHRSGFHPMDDRIVRLAFHANPAPVAGVEALVLYRLLEEHPGPRPTAFGERAAEERSRKQHAPEPAATAADRGAFVFNDFAGNVPSGRTSNVLHSSTCGFVRRMNANVPKVWFATLDEAEKWLLANRGPNWKHCGSCFRRG